MRWWEIEIQSTSEAAEAVAEMLLSEGAAGVASEDPEEIKRLLLSPDSLIFTDPQFLDELPDYVRIRAYFSDESREVLCERIAGGLGRVAEYLNLGRGLVGCEPVDEADWANNWKAYYHPLKISERLVVCPSWENYEAKAEELVITLDPGSAFGTGEHATTALCLRMLDEQLVPGQNVLDLGAGSGILAIAAAKLGATRVEAIDLDPNAVKVAAENASLNTCAAQIDCHAGELKDARCAHYDLIAANILAEVHLSLAPEYAERLRPGARLILGGIIGHKADAVRAALLACGFSLLQESVSDDWHALLLERI